MFLYGFRLLIVVLVPIGLVLGHGRMLNPAGRSSIWRVDKKYTGPRNYDDNGLNCGGFSKQYVFNGGKCGPCGDDYSLPPPRANENGGYYGKGYLVGRYQPGAILNVQIDLTANHRGTFDYSLCHLEEPFKKPESEECFEAVPVLEFDTDSGSEYTSMKYRIRGNNTAYHVENRVPLPKTLKKGRYVFRWNYIAGNNWGPCGNGTGAVGCGNQEMFRSCADIGIY